MKLINAIDTFSVWRSFRVKPRTVNAFGETLRQFSLFLRNPEIEEMTLDDIMAYVESVAALGCRRRTLADKLRAIRLFCSFCRKQGLHVIDPKLIPVPREAPKLPRVATEEHYVKLVGAIPRDLYPQHARDRAIATLLWDTGMRVGELVALDVADVDPERRRALIKTEKSRGRRPLREIFWTPDANGYLAEWLEAREEVRLRDREALFVSVGNHREGLRLTIAGVGDMLRRYSRRAGIPYLNAHSFRHHLGHEIIKQGGSAADVMNILGHASLQSSSVYTMMTGKELERRYRAIKGW